MSREIITYDFEDFKGNKKSGWVAAIVKQLRCQWQINAIAPLFFEKRAKREKGNLFNLLMERNDKNMEKKNELNVESTIYLEKKIVKSLKSGKEFTNYIVRAKFPQFGRNEEEEIQLTLPQDDFGMADVVDMVFGNRGKVPLLQRVNKMRNPLTRTVTTRYSYFIVSENGELEATLVPFKGSQEAKLRCLFAQLKGKDNLEDDEDEEEVE